MATKLGQKPERLSGKGAPPVSRGSENLRKPDREALKPLNFRVPGEFHRRFKMYAVERGMSMVELLETSFEEFVKARNE